MKNYPHYQDLRPRKTYSKELSNYLKKYSPQIDDIAIDFIERLLHLDPTKRMSCEEALRHAFFTEKPLACSLAEVQKMGTECHEMFKDRSIPIKRETTEKVHRPK